MFTTKNKDLQGQQVIYTVVFAHNSSGCCCSLQLLSILPRVSNNINLKMISLSSHLSVSMSQPLISSSSQSDSSVSSIRPFSVLVVLVATAVLIDFTEVDQW